MKILIAIKIATLMGIVCFFFPFMMVSCSVTGTNVRTIEVKGTDMVFGSAQLEDYAETFGEEVFGEEDSGNVDEEPSTFNWFICIAAICAVAELFSLAHMGRAARVTAICLIIFRLSAKWYYSIDGKSLADYGDLVSIEFGFALYLAIVIFGVLSIFP